MLGRGAAGAVWLEGTAFQQLIKNEIASVREQQRILLAQGRIGYITICILITCILGNIAAFLTIPDYTSLFIAASLYLHMVYFITLLVPMGKGTLRFPTDRIFQFFSTLYHTGIIQATDRFTRIILDVFFINSRTLFSGFLCIFSFDILFTLTEFFSGAFSLQITLVILFQVFVFLTYYFLVWRFEPGSRQFREGISGAKEILSIRRYPPWLIGLLFGSGALLVLLGILSTIILLPGITVHAFVTLSGLENLGDLFLFIGLIAVSQYFIVRFFHGISGSRMAARFSESKILMLQSAKESQEARQVDISDRDAAPFTAHNDALRGAAGALLESRIYRLDLQTFWGAFPVYLVNIDFSVIFDEDVIAAITGYLKGAGSAGTGDT